MSTVERTLRVQATVASVGMARRALDDVPELRMLPRLRFDAGLLVTELVANSVRHAGLPSSAQITIGVSFDGGRLRVAVADSGPGFAPPNLAPPPQGASGRGLFLVEALADDWGVDTGEQTVVWFEMAADRP